MVDQNELVSMTCAAQQYRVPLAAILRMETEGLVEILKLDGDYFLRRTELAYVAELARTDTKFLTCTCIAGPCHC